MHGPRRPHLNFTPTSSSWLNLIERWFKELADKRLRRGAFNSVAELTTAITTCAEHWNLDPKPFVWKATADDIVAKVQRTRQFPPDQIEDGPLAVNFAVSRQFVLFCSPALAWGILFRYRIS